VILLEAEAGSARREALQEWLEESRAGRAVRTWLVSCDFEEGGVWTGVRELLLEVLPHIEETAPHLILKHGYELTIVLPHLRDKIPVRHPLTETVSTQEKVRNYPVDRAYRIVHGIVNLLAEWHRHSGGGVWLIACDNFDRAGAMTTRFFAELMRRRGEQLRLTMLVATAPASGEAVASKFESQQVGPFVRLSLPPDTHSPVDPVEAARLASELEERVKHDQGAVEMCVPQLIRYNASSGRQERASRWQAAALGFLNHHGFYEDALRYSEAVSSQLESLCGDDEVFRWNLVGNLFGCYVAVGDSARAYSIVVDEALSRIKHLSQRVKVYYVMGMLYARYLPESDLEKASAYLEEGLRDIPRAELTPDEESFHTAFMMNGLALVRHRQKRVAEAVELCQRAGELLDANLRPDQHRLHRSVLQYNIAQVYAFTGRLDDAIAYYTAAMEMDPNYSEYYNERGSAYLKLGNTDKALEDFLQAVELSPPYPEVLTNLGQCYQLLDRVDEAIEAYSASLDLVPAQGLALTGRAQAFEARGELDAALADYSASLALDPAQPLVLSNRAVLHYERGDVEQALDDLNRAVTLSPRMAELYQNRSIALADLGRRAEAVSDLRRYLELSPGATDRREVLERLSELEAVASSV
jgi:tetratricopeptide (TPR) repeat protein